MPVIMCPSDNDEHAPFAHRLVIPISTVTSHGVTTTTMSPSVFVICAECDHYPERPAGRCRCALDCHARMREIRDQTVTENRPRTRKVA